MAMDRENVSAFSSRKSFEGFTPDDFSAYEQKKWSSNAFTLARRTAKDKLLLVAHSIEAELKEELAGLDLFGSDEAPTMANGRKVEAQWAYFIREAPTRTILKPRLQTTDLGAASLFDISIQSQHLALSIRLDAHGIHVGLDFPSKAIVDRDNLKVLLDSESARADIIELCRVLPGQSWIGFADEPDDVLNTDDASLLAYAGKLSEHSSLFSLSTAISVDDAFQAAEGLIGTIVQIVGAYIPLYRYLAWSEDRDHIGLCTSLKADEKLKQVAHVATFQIGDRVNILSGLFSGRMGYLQELNDSGKAKVMVGPIAVNVDAKDLKAN